MVLLRAGCLCEPNGYDGLRPLLSLIMTKGRKNPAVHSVHNSYLRNPVRPRYLRTPDFCGPGVSPTSLKNSISYLSSVVAR
jgi:hypothetical protein